MRYLYVLLLTCILFGNSYADENHYQTIQPPTIVLNESFTQRIVEVAHETALAISAARCDFGDAGRTLQICVGLGQYDTNVGATVGAGMVINNTLWNGSLSTEGGNTAVGFGWTWHVR